MRSSPGETDRTAGTDGGTGVYNRSGIAGDGDRVDRRASRRRSLRIALVTGSYPPDACGVGAYVERLAHSLHEAGVDVHVLCERHWRATTARALHARLEALQPDLVHLQYPTLGYGVSLAPQLLSVLRRSVVTIHEVRHTHPLRRLSLTPFALTARHVVFTTDHERKYALRFAPWLTGRSSVIGVGSSILPIDGTARRRTNEVLHFGLIRPRKGLEDVIQLARLLDKESSDWRIRIVGDVAPKSTSYFDSLREYAADAPVTWEIGLSPEQVADVLAESRLGYLPFPDGASERRTSLVALLAAGVVTITTRGADTPTALTDAVEFAASPQEAHAIVERLSTDAAAADCLAANGRRYARGVSWERIAALHCSLYERLVMDR